MHELAWWLSVALMLALTIVFWAVLRTASERPETADTTSSPYRFRKPGFWILVGVGVVVTLASLRYVPYGAAAGATEPQIVNVIGHQWSWELSRDEVVAGRPVEFRVTSADVNHGFGIYDQNLRLVAQTQAMPSYVNRIVHTFERPGTYRILCLEYCGLLHHDMPAKVRVVAK